MTFEINTSLFETGPVVILSWDGALIENTIHPMLFASPNVVKLLGYSVEELLNRSIEYGDIIHSDDIGRVVKTIEANQDAGILSFSDQYRVRKKNGEYIWVSDHTQYVLDDAGKTVRMDGYITDITDLVETRQKAEQARIERLAAERFSKNKSQFLANMSHEIRTPMNGVIGMVDILSRSDLDGRQSDIVQTIIRSGNALVRIINDILEFSKLESGKIILDSEPFNLSEAIFDVVQLLRVSIDEEAIDLLIRVDPEIASVALGDVGRFRQILMNLIGNAIKFTEKGHVLIYMTADKGPDDIVHYKIDVQDTGIGIAEDKLHDIFHSFNQADNSTTRQFGGTGLGLSIARDLARLMGGDITVSSALGQGATFSFTFKLHCVDEAHGKTGLQRGKLIENATKSVIVLDDNRVNLDILEEQLKHLGYE
ncbi:MAG: ATP-binding protein, partial [Litorimonas sp.]